jgi:PAT family beta-lactamase induction signal transducer AmpG
MREATTDIARAPDPPPFRRRLAFVRALTRPKVALMLALGFSSGLPFMLIGNTLGFWLADAGVKLSVIGFTSWIGLTYSVKFLWGAVVDRLPPPLPGRLGRRRGWMIVTQVAVGAGLIGMAASDPRAGLGALVAFGLLTGVAAAAQDTVVDAWRIESSASAEELGLLTAAYSLGYRVALIGTEAVILLLANAVGWPASYAAYGLLMAVGVAAALMVREPARDALAGPAPRFAGAAAAPSRVLRSAIDSVVGPFIAFFRAHGLVLAALMLGMITLYHLCDYMRGPMSNPYYKALGIPKPTIAGVRAGLGLAGSLAGIALGGGAVARLGHRRALILGAVLQPIAVAAFALLAWRGGDFTLLTLGPLKLTGFEAIMTFDSVVMAFAGVALVAYMSTLTSLGYTATQYALLTSAMTWTGKTAKGFSGEIVESLRGGRTLLEAYGLYYALAAAIGLPAIALCLVLAARPRRAPRDRPALVEPS